MVVFSVWVLYFEVKIILITIFNFRLLEFEVLELIQRIGNSVLTFERFQFLFRIKHQVFQTFNKTEVNQNLNRYVRNLYRSCLIIFNDCLFIKVVFKNNNFKLFMIVGECLEQNLIICNFTLYQLQDHVEKFFH